MWAFFWILLGNFADLDFLPGILLGEPSRFHHGLTHSLLFTLVLSLAAYKAYPRLFKERASLWPFLAVAGSHLFLDCLTYDTAPPFGLPLLWPFSHACFRFPFSLFLNVNRAMSFGLLFSWHNLLALILEVIVTLPFLLWVWAARRRKGSLRLTGSRVSQRNGSRVLPN